MSRLTLISSNNKPVRRESFTDEDIAEQIEELSATAERISEKLAELHRRPFLSTWQIIVLGFVGIMFML